MDPSSFLGDDLFADKNVFVTGGSSGIGLAIARGFVECGASVTICGRDAGRLADAVDELHKAGRRAIGLVADVRDACAIESALEAARHAHGATDVVICGAAGNFLARAEALSPNAFRTVVDIDLNGSFYTARAALDQLQETQGSVIFITAGQAFVPFSHQAHAGAAKAGIENLMRNLAIEWGRYGIRCNSIAPGPIAGTEGARRLSERIGADNWARMIPLRRFGSLPEIVAMALVLASPLAAYVTGATVVVDGGYALTGCGQFAAALDAASAQ
jgi:NAD(P)-dependent dehydrogenase (short-subunit alcohol dehydrogenase family)